MFKVLVNVHLKAEILDPQGRTILAAINRLGLTDVADLRQGKQFILELKTEPNEDLMRQIDSVASTLLCNPVIETYSIEVKNES